MLGTKAVVKETLIILVRYGAVCNIEDFIISTGISSCPALVFDLNPFTMLIISDSVVS